IVRSGHSLARPGQARRPTDEVDVDRTEYRDHESSSTGLLACMNVIAKRASRECRRAATRTRGPEGRASWKLGRSRQAGRTSDLRGASFRNQKNMIRLQSNTLDAGPWGSRS